MTISQVFLDACIDVREDGDYEGSPCWMCGTPTPYIEVNFEAYTCSEECWDAAWARYHQDCFRSDCTEFCRLMEVIGATPF